MMPMDETEESDQPKIPIIRLSSLQVSSVHGPGMSGWPITGDRLPFMLLNWMQSTSPE